MNRLARSQRVLLQRHVPEPPPHPCDLVPLELAARPDRSEERAHPRVDGDVRARVGRAGRGEHLRDPLLARGRGVVHEPVQE